MDPAKVLALVRSSGAQINRVLLVGCEPAPLDPSEDIQVELSPPVQAAIDPAIKMVESLVDSFIANPSEKELNYAHVSSCIPAPHGAIVLASE
jgi:hydrogenase maturation protease